MPLANAVFEGGGVRGIGLVGALLEAEARGYTWREVAGTSAGAIVASLVAAGYGAAEITAIMAQEVDYRAFLQRTSRFPIPILADLIGLWRYRGLHRADYILDLMGRLLTRKLGKPVVSFRDLPIPCHTIAADVTNQRMVVLPDDLKDYGHPDPLDFPVAQAVRASMSIPFFFTPYVLRYTVDGAERTATLVDGGMLSNFPVWLFDPRGTPPSVPTIGFLLQAPGTAGPRPTGTMMEFLHAVVSTILDGRDDYDLTHQDYERTIVIDTGAIKTTEFDLSPADRDWLKQSGQQAAAAFFSGYSFASWLEKFSHMAARPRQP